MQKRTASAAPKHLRRQEVRIARVSNRNASDVEQRMVPENHNYEASLVPAANAAEAPNSFLSEFNSIVMTRAMVACDTELRRLMAEEKEEDDDSDAIV